MAATGILRDHPRSSWVRLRTLVMLRWIAVAGQTGAVLVALYGFGLRLELGPISVAIGLSVLGNLLSTFLYPGTKRLTEREATLMLFFDIMQLGLLLFLTGGLDNPFALLLLAPVTIAATFLHLRSAVLLGLSAVALISIMAEYNLPVFRPDGEVLQLPALFHLGFWSALVIGVAFLGLYARQVTSEMNAMGDALLATQLALEREQKLTDLGGVVAAAAHELGTPLATIKLVSAELVADAAGDPDLLEDLLLIRAQADRCRDILQSMGRAGKNDNLLRSAPLEAVVREAAEPHLDRGKAIAFYLAPNDTGEGGQPSILRRPEIIHGLRNLVQNGVDFAKGGVDIESGWTANSITVRITDDGPGFTQSSLSRIGDPFIRGRRANAGRETRPGYEGMGLGLFIAKTLLERSGARLVFANSSSKLGGKGGALVIVEWPRAVVEAPPAGARGPLGANLPIGA